MLIPRKHHSLLISSQTFHQTCLMKPKHLKLDITWYQDTSKHDHTPIFVRRNLKSWGIMSQELKLLCEDFPELDPFSLETSIFLLRLSQSNSWDATRILGSGTKGISAPWMVSKSCTTDLVISMISSTFWGCQPRQSVRMAIHLRAIASRTFCMPFSLRASVTWSSSSKTSGTWRRSVSNSSRKAASKKQNQSTSQFSLRREVSTKCPVYYYCILFKCLFSVRGWNLVYKRCFKESKVPVSIGKEEPAFTYERWRPVLL